MLIEVFKEAWVALGRNRVRSLLTMTGISWGIVAVTLLLSYGSGSFVTSTASETSCSQT